MLHTDGPTPDSRRRYAAAAEQYHRHRPSYPPALLDWILASTGRKPPARVADVGCGTGIATRLFAARGFDSIGIDPSAEMLAFARREGRALYLRAEAAATGLVAGSIDLVTAAQSFHWFDTASTMAEFRRILRPDGWCAAFWNLRAATPFTDDYDRLLCTHTSQYDVMLRQDAAPAALRAAPGLVGRNEAEFANAQWLDLAGLLGRAYSSSCVALGVADADAFRRALTEVFERHQQQGRVEFRYRTVAFCWQLAPA
jgi:SAM-dependent methyltransferase